MKQMDAVQKRLLQERMEQMQEMTEAIDNTMETIRRQHRMDGSRLLDLIHMAAEEKNLKSQYQNAANISARIRLHREYSNNSKGWFPWLMEQYDLKPGMRILELGCGNGALWTENRHGLPKDMEVFLVNL